MSAFSQFTWYVLTNALQNVNNTLTAANNTQSAFNPDAPSSIYFSPSNNGSVALSQQWQISPVTTSSASAYILRNRQIGPLAYLTTAISTKKCGGGTCATVPVLSPDVNSASLWNFGGWGFADAIGGASIYNLGNTSSWRLDMMLSGPDSEMVNTTDNGGGGQHWFFSAHEAFAATESSSYSAVPTTVTALLAQFTNSDSVATPSIQTNTAGFPSTTTTTTGGAAATETSNSSSGGLSTGAAAGIGVGVAVAVIAIFIVAFLLFRQRRRKTLQQQPSEMSTTDNSPTGGTLIGSDASTYTAGKSSAGRSEMQSPSEFARAELKGPAVRSEMQSPSESSRAELYSPPAQEVKRYEMPHPSNSPRSVEMEHPSTRNSTTVTNADI